MGKQLEVEPKNKDELLELKNVIAENEVNLKKLRLEVDHVYNFMLIMEDYSY